MKPKSFTKSLSVGAVALTLAIPCAVAQQTSDPTWTGTDGDWADATWSGGVEPLADSLPGILNGGTVGVTAETAILEQLEVGGGSTLNLAATVIIDGTDVIDVPDPDPDIPATGFWGREATINVNDGGGLFVETGGQFRIGQDAAGVLNVVTGGLIQSDIPLVFGAGGGGSATVTMTDGELFHTGADAKLGGWGSDCTWDLSGGTVEFNRMLCGFGNAGGTVVVNHTGGDLSLTGENCIGWATFEGASITYNLSGTGTLTTLDNRLQVGRAGKGSHSVLLNQTGGELTTAGRLDICEANDATNVGTNVYDMSGGTATIGSWMFVGAFGTTGTGTLNVSGTANLTANGMLIGNGLSGTVNVSGGTVTLGNRLRIGSNNGSTATNQFNLTGGVVNVANRVDIGENATQTNELNVSGGTLTLTGADKRMLVGFYNDGTGSFTLSGTGVVNAEQVVLGDNAGPNIVLGTKGTVNLNGGTLIANRIRKGGGDAADQFLNLNGGTIQARADAVTLIENSLTNIALLAGGVTFDTDGWNASTSGVMTGVGGLTKTGAGTLTVNGVQAYSGDTTVEGGTLVLKEPYLDDAADVRLTTGATLDLSHVVAATDTIGALYIDGVPQAIGEWGSAASGAANSSTLLAGLGKLNVTSAGGPDVDPEITSITVDEIAGTAEIVMNGAASTTYVCKYSDDLATAFAPIATTPSTVTTDDNGDGTGDATFTVDASVAARFYLVEE